MVTDVTLAEVDDAFYKSYGEGGAGLDPRLKGKGGKGRRRVTKNAKDSQFRECWMEVRRLLREAKGVCPINPSGSIGSGVMACPAVNKKDNPAYEPALWNDHAIGGPVQTSTNCYAYAMNSRAGHPAGGKPQPGSTSGTATASPVTCPSTTAAVVADGQPDNIVAAPRCPYNQQQKQPPPDKAGYYLVALVITSKPDGYDPTPIPGHPKGVFYYNDYHWYRQNPDGTWSHKPGHDVARDVDASGAKITNPELANRRSVAEYLTDSTGALIAAVFDYDIFCGYFYVKKGGATV